MNFLHSMLAACFLAASFAAVPAAAQTTEADIVRARTTQLYLRAEDGLRDLFDAEAKFERARSVKDREGMTVAAAEMFSGATDAAYWSVVLDERVKELGARQEILDLSGELRAITTRVYARMADIVSTGDMDALAAALDDSADGMTRLRDVVAKIYQVIHANVTGQ